VRPPKGHDVTKNLKVGLALGAAALGLVLMGAGGGGATIDSKRAHELVEKQRAVLLDVRTPDEFAGGHLDGATNIPVQELEARLAQVPAKKDQDIVVYCRSGVRSAKAKAMLEKAGFTKVHDLGGIGNW
jgi:rhodanese-related sulfurtransferase